MQLTYGLVCNMEYGAFQQTGRLLHYLSNFQNVGLHFSSQRVPPNKNKKRLSLLKESLDVIEIPELAVPLTPLSIPENLVLLFSLV